MSRRFSLAEVVFTLLTTSLIAVGAYWAWTGVARFLLLESARRPPVFVVLATLSFLPFVALLLGQLLLLRAGGSATLCVTAMLVASVSAFGYGDASASHAILLPPLLAWSRSDGSFNLRRTAFAEALQLGIALCGLALARVMWLWSEQPDSNELHWRAPRWQSEAHGRSLSQRVSTERRSRMVRVTGFYKWKAGAHFDHDYYRTKHMPFARQLLTPFGLLRLESDEFLVGAELKDGDIIAATYGYFESTAAAQAALAATGQDLLKSVPNYSTLTPELVMSVVTSHL